MPFELVARPDDGSNVITLAPGETAPGFNEKRRYSIELPAADSTLVIDDQEFRSDDGTVEWTPGFFAGAVAAELLDPDGRTVASYTLDVSPDPGKLGSDVFRSMLEDLWKFDPALVLGTEPSTRNVGITGAYASDWLTYARLRRYADDYLPALARIAVHPLRELRTRREHVPLPRVRRIDRLTGLSIQRQPALLAAVRGQDVALRTAALRLDVPVSEETLDSAATGCWRGRPDRLPGASNGSWRSSNRKCKTAPRARRARRLRTVGRGAANSWRRSKPNSTACAGGPSSARSCAPP